MSIEIISTTIVPAPTWGKTLEMFQKFGHVYLIDADSARFEEILGAAKLPYRVEKTTKGTLNLNKFIQYTPQETQQKFEIVITDRKVAGALSIFDTLHESGLFIEGYYKMAFVSWGPGEYTVHFKGSVSSIVEQTISRLIGRKYGTKLIRR